MTTTVQIDRRKLNFSNLDKVLYPSGHTKADVIHYYAQIATFILPHLRNRHLTLKRYPDGTTAEYFFEKQCPAHRPPWVKTAGILTSRRERTIDFCVVEDKPSLLWVANLAALELHIPLALASDPDHATCMVFDLDPGTPADIIDCARLALQFKDLLDHLNLKSFPKTSGGKGLHLWIPLNTKPTFDDTKSFANALASLFARQHPKQVTATMTRSLRPGKVFVDWSQNDRGKTTVAPYSLRAKDTPTVSTPVTWAEVERAAKQRDHKLLMFEADDVLDRVEKIGDLFKPILKIRQKLPKQ